MRTLIIGGTGFLGPPLVRRLHRQGHTLAVLHRGNAAPELPPGVERMRGDRKRLPDLRERIARFAPDVVIDLILSSGKQARQLMETLRGITRRVVITSSMDVYRAFAVVNRQDTGPLQPLPLTENSDLRTVPPYPPEKLKTMQSIFSWLDEDYDKIPVERAVLSDPELAGVVLRLPMIYGPGDPLHRLFPYLKRMDDGRKTIVLADDYAAWRAPRGYVENIAAAIALAAVSDQAAGSVYNVAEQRAFSEFEWAKKIAEQTGWRGQLVVLPRQHAPKHLRFPGNLAQHGDACSERIRRELGYQEPVPPNEALRRTIAWERAHPPVQVPQAMFDYAAEDAAVA